MKEADRIADQLLRALSGPAWHGPAVMKILEDVTADQAAARPIKDAHSIWELTQHITAWQKACLRRLQGDPAELSDEEDWPAINETSEKAWAETKEDLMRSNEELRTAISSLDDSKLDQTIVPGKHSAYVTMQGVVQHDLYHAGQIAILKKALSGG